MKDYDLEEAAKQYRDEFLDKNDNDISKYDIEDIFIAGANWQKQQLIDEACKWLIEHKEEVETEDNGIIGWIPDYFIEDFRKAMED